jgi:uncharacterized protein (TIGR02145 family)
MKKALYLLFGIFLVSSCSTNNESTKINNEEATLAPPIAPTNLTLTHISPTQIDLSWTDNSNDETGFKIERRKGTDPYAIIGTVDANVTIFSDNNLIPSFTYTYKVYAYNVKITSTTNSSEVSVTTSIPIVVPTLTTTLPSYITITTASSGGDISSNGGAPVTARGIVWSTSAYPTIALTSKTTDGSGLGNFSSSITSLIPSSSYFVRAYATNSVGTAYGNELSFITSNFSSTELNVQGFNVIDIDGNIYQTVKNCDQTWTKTNLNVSKYRNGDIIPEIKDPSQWANLTTGAWCYYNNDSATGAIYGKLYNWYAVNDPRGLAPIGYHIPSDTEWRTLTTCLGGEIVAGGKMKEAASSQTDQYSWYYDSGATNSSGFSAKPASWRYTESSGTLFGENKLIKMDAFWWSSTGYVSGVASLRNIQASSNSLNIQVFSHIKSNGLSIRCVKN